ncbi:MAG: hypothetical protein ACREAB_01030 [Blastocatellia bacterium]
MTDSTQRFSSRVENYIKYRPGYPNEVVETLQTEERLAAPDKGYNVRRNAINSARSSAERRRPNS